MTDQSSQSDPLATFFSDPKKIAALIGAGLLTLLGFPELMEYGKPIIWSLAVRQYPEYASLVFWMIVAVSYVACLCILYQICFLGVLNAYARAFGYITSSSPNSTAKQPLPMWLRAPLVIGGGFAIYLGFSDLESVREFSGGLIAGGGIAVVAGVLLKRNR